MASVHRARIIAGLLLSVAGTSVLLSRVGVDRAGRIAADWWPVVFIALGIRNVMTFALPPFKPTKMLAPVVGALAIAVAGGVGLTITLDALPNDAGRYLLTVALLGGGTAVALIGGTRYRAFRPWIAETAVLCHRRAASRQLQLRRLSAVAVLGQVSLDLAEASFSGGTELYATAWAGQVRVRIPEMTPVRCLNPSGPGLTVKVPAAPSAPQGAELVVSLMGAHGRLVIDRAG